MKDDSNRSLRRVNRKGRGAADRTVEVDSSAFFAEDPAPTPPPRKKPNSSAPRRSGAEAQAAAAAPSKFGKILLPVQGILSVASLVQLWRTQMLPVLYLVILAALLALLWLLVKRCQEYNVPGKVARVFSVFLCAAMALGCFWAQQGLSALGSMTSGLLTGAEANKITKEPFVIYLSGVDTRGELTENARSDVNILAAVNPVTKRVALINTPRDYYVDLAGTDSKDKLTHAGLYGVETSMATLGNLYGVNVDHYIRINFAGFISIIDALGGVDVYSDQAFTSVGSPGYYDPTTFVEGWNHLDGKAALAFARERHAFASGDIQRGINQMKVIDAMLNKIKSPALLMGFSKIMDAASDCFVTDFSQDQISALVRMQLSDFANWDIQSYTVTGSSGTSTQCYSAKGQKLYVMTPDEASVSKAKEMIALYTNNKVATLQAANDFDGIIAMADALLAKNAENALAQKVRLQAYASKKDYNKVIELGEAAAKVQTDPEDVSLMYLTLGAAYNAKEMKPQAIEAFRKVTAGPAVESAKAALAELTK